MISRAVLFVVALLSIGLALPSQAQAIDNRIDGGPGGGPFRIQCDGFMTGFEGRTGAFIDQFRILCGAYDINTRQMQNRGALQITIGTSDGGGPAAVACPAGWGIQSISFQNTYRSESNEYKGFVHHISFNCVSLSSPGSIWRTYGPTTPRATPKEFITGTLEISSEQSCPQGELAVGFQGRSGQYVDALGLICAPVPVAAPQPVTPQAMSNGKLSTTPSMSKQVIVPKPTGPAAPPPGLPGVTSGTQMTSDSGPVVKHSGFTGVWNTRTDKNWTYVITFNQDGKNVNGTYVVQNGDKGKISGKVKDDVLEFKLEQDGGYKGTGQFALAADGNSFTGSYRIEPNKKITDPSYLQGTWSGTRR